jgi:hypothetical protein
MYHYGDLIRYRIFGICGLAAIAIALLTVRVQARDPEALWVLSVRK